MTIDRSSIHRPNPSINANGGGSAGDVFHNINGLGVRNGDNTRLNSLHVSAVGPANIRSDISLGSLESDCNNSSVISNNNNNVTSPKRILLTSNETKEKHIKKYVNYSQWIILLYVIL